jgi:hypothetical protein
MNWRLVFAVACASILSACSHTSEIGYERGKTPPKEMLRFVEGKTVVVTLRDSAMIVGNVLGASLDTLQVLEVDSVSARRLPMETVREIRVDGSALGPVGGLAAGGLVGVLIGSAIGRDQGGNEPFHNLAATGAVLSCGSLGAVIGAIICAEATATHEFRPPRKVLRPLQRRTQSVH